MRKLTGVGLAFVLVFSMSACDQAGPDKPVLEASETPVQTTSPPIQPTPDEPRVVEPTQAALAADHLQYYELDQAQTELYYQLLDGITNLELRIPVDSYWQSEQADQDGSTVFEILERNNPEIFWFPKTRYQGTDRNGSFEIRPLYRINGHELVARLNDSGEFDLPSDEDMAKARAWIANGRAAIDHTIANLPLQGQMTPFEMEVAVHDWLYNHVEYSMEAPDKYSMYGAMVDGRATCEGYAKSFQYIMRLLGIETLRYSGFLNESPDTGHTWNAIKLDGQWYQVDVTSNATSGNSIDEPRFHQFFNRTDSYMLASHTLNDVAYNPVISCTATEYDYYRYTGTYIASDQDFVSRVPAAMVKARAEGQPTFELEFDPAWAPASEIEHKKPLIDQEHWRGVRFFYLKESTLVFGWFE